MVAIFVISGSGTGNGRAWPGHLVCTADFHGDTTTQTWALLPTGERANCSRGDQGLWTIQRELRGLTMSGPALRFKCTAVGFPVITSLASFWNSESQGFRTWIIMDQSQSTKIQVRICSEHGNFQGKTFISNSLNWPCHDSAFVCSTA